MPSLWASSYVNRDSGDLALNFDYYIESYFDPETNEQFGDTTWYVSYNEIDPPPGQPAMIGQNGGTSWESGFGDLQFFLPLVPAGLRHVAVDFSAFNTFTAGYNGFSVSHRYDLFLAAYETAALKIDGTANADIMLTGSGTDTLAGYDNNDYLDGGAGNDTLSGGAGADTLVGSTGSDVMVGGADGDVYYVDNLGDVVTESTNDFGSDMVVTTVSFTLGANVEDVRLESGAGAINATGNALGNTLSGNEAANRLTGLDGNDYIEGLGGDDLIRGGAGNDTLNGGSGNDLIIGGLGNDLYIAPQGARIVERANEGTADKVVSQGSFVLPAHVEILQLGGFSENYDGTGNASSNLIYGNSGNNTLSGRGSFDILNGQDGDDTLIGGADGDALMGGRGSDTAAYTGSFGGVIVSLWSGQGIGADAEGDTYGSIENLLGSAYNDQLTGDGGDNVLGGAAGDDYIRGDSGDDLIIGGAGRDYMDGGPGIDTMSYAGAAGGVIVSLRAHVAKRGHATGDGFANIENVTGGEGNDVLSGDDLANVLSGRAGADTLNGGLGSDTVIGGAGADVMNGGAGIDTVSYQAATRSVRVDLTTQTASGGEAQGDTLTQFENAIGGRGNDTLVGSDGANQLTGGAGNDTLVGRGGDDTIAGGEGADTLNGGAGIDTLSYAGSTAAGVYVQLSIGYASNGDASGDVIANFENLIGTEQSDFLAGDAGNNRIEGRSGGDGLDGGAGHDTLTGGAGPDNFYFGIGGGHDVVTDFRHGEDFLVLSLGEAFNTYAEIMAVAMQVGTSVVFQFDANTSLTLHDTTLASISLSDFYLGG